MTPITRFLVTLVLSQVVVSVEAAAPKSPSRTALVIGNARYEAAVGPLRNTGNDAKAVAKALRGLGFAVIEKHDVTRDQLFKAVMDFRATLSGAEVGLFYYAGHGISVGGSNYLISLKSGYNPEGADDVTLRMLAETKLFNVEQAVADMGSAGAQCNVIILDACRTTAVARTGRTRDVASTGGLAEMKPPAGSLIAFATDAGQTAQDGQGSNGLYTEELLKHLRTPGLSIEQVFKRTRAGVLERSEGGQIPAEYSRLVGEDIYLAGSGPVTSATSSLAVKAPETTAVSSVRAMRAANAIPVVAPPVAVPTLKDVLVFAANGKARECVDGLKQMANANGPGSYAVAPLEVLLEQAKEDLKDTKASASKQATVVSRCSLVLDHLDVCLPEEHEKKPQLKARAFSRRGDALLVLGQPEEALRDFEAAMPLMPEDAYIVYNRGRAYLALGRKDEARADFTTAMNPKWRQPGAQKLAAKALAEAK
jgi:uncharacterized caspase-like protein